MRCNVASNNVRCDVTETLVAPVTAPVVTPTKSQALKSAKASKAKPNLQVKGKRAVKSAPTVRKFGRGKLIDTLKPDELKAEIREFLDDLKASSDPEEKKRIRRALRLRGHHGGLNQPRIANDKK